MDLNGTTGSNDGWLVLIVRVALGWARSMARGSWTGVAGVLGAALVIGWTAVDDWLDGRDVFGATAGLRVVADRRGELSRTRLCGVAVRP